MGNLKTGLAWMLSPLFARILIHVLYFSHTFLGSLFVSSLGNPLKHKWWSLKMAEQGQGFEWATGTVQCM